MVAFDELASASGWCAGALEAKQVVQKGCSAICKTERVVWKAPCRRTHTKGDREQTCDCRGGGKWVPSIFNHYRSLMSLSYRLGIQNRKVTSNPARPVMHRREDNKRVRFLTAEKERKLWKVIQRKWSYHLPEFELALNTASGRAVSTD